MSFKNNERVYLDTAFLIAYLIEDHEKSSVCKKIFAECLANNCTLTTSFFTFSEIGNVIQKLGNQKELDRRNANKGRLQKVLHTLCKRFGYKKINREAKTTRPLSAFHDQLSGICSRLRDPGFLEILYPKTDDQVSTVLQHTLDTVKTHQQQMKDAFHIGHMKVFNISTAITGDSDFERVKDMNVVNYNKL